MVFLNGAIADLWIGEDWGFESGDDQQQPAQALAQAAPPQVQPPQPQQLQPPQPQPPAAQPVGVYSLPSYLSA